MQPGPGFNKHRVLRMGYNPKNQLTVQPASVVLHSSYFVDPLGTSHYGGVFFSRIIVLVYTRYHYVSLFVPY